jgi:predicted HicB family RNase H-like nuclease
MSTTAPNILQHKGYVGTVEVDLDSGLLHGTVQGINDVVHYEATTVKALTKAFRASVDDYLAMCAAAGESPDKPYSGKFQIRLGEDLHRQAAARAAAEGVSLNDLTVSALEQRIKQEDNLVGRIGSPQTSRHAAS